MVKITIGLSAIVTALSDMSDDDVARIVDEIPEDKMKIVDDMAMQFCNDRGYCKLLNIPYSDIQANDMQRFRALSYNMLLLQRRY